MTQEPLDSAGARLGDGDQVPIGVQEPDTAPLRESRRGRHLRRPDKPAAGRQRRALPASV